LAKAANVSVVAVALDARSACLHSFKPTGQNIEDVSVEQIYEAIASAATPSEKTAEIHRNPGQTRIGGCGA
jgi:hypothetical protein